MQSGFKQTLKSVDMFAGIGGFTEGARQADIETVWAANHWPAAVHWHQRNHPNAIHACQDLQQADFRDVPVHDILLASPACQGHARARGREKPHHDALRATAWAVVTCAEVHRSSVVVVENVPEFLKWTLYPAWLDAMQRLGYSVSPHMVDAADHGVPQNRVRLFLVCTRSANPLTLGLPHCPHVPVNSVIEWDAHPWTLIDKPGRSVATLRRCAAGRARFGHRFVTPFYGSGSGLSGRSVQRPLGTLTTKDRWMVVSGDRCRMLQISEACAVMGFRPDLQLPGIKEQATKMLGNAVCPPVARDILLAVRAAA